MRTKRAIENQLRHFRNGCPKAGTEENDTWIKALEWVLAGDDPEVDSMSAFGKLVSAAIAARHALRSYQYGNAAADLACEIADQLDRAIPEALEGRGQDLDEMSAVLKRSVQILDDLYRIHGGSPDEPDAKTPAH